MSITVGHNPFDEWLDAFGYDRDELSDLDLDNAYQEFLEHLDQQ
jgi:hypothetical protein